MPNRLELLLRLVCALPNASSTGFNYYNINTITYNKDTYHKFYDVY